MKVKDVEIPIAIRIRNFLKKHPDEVFSSRDVADKLGCSVENLTHHKAMSVKIGTLRYYSHTEKHLQELKERLSNAY